MPLSGNFLDWEASLLGKLIFVKRGVQGERSDQARPLHRGFKVLRLLLRVRCQEGDSCSEPAFSLVVQKKALNISLQVSS